MMMDVTIQDDGYHCRRRWMSLPKVMNVTVKYNESAVFSGSSLALFNHFLSLLAKG
jgi:hypothetical protein